MSTKKAGGLGRGLDALIHDNTYDKPEHLNPESELITPATGIAEIAIDRIETNPYQPRTEFDADALQELSDSIRVQGIIQPITVRRLSDDQYQLISGERRLQASKIAGLTTIPAYIRTANDEQMLEFALIENIQRQDLNPLEVALAYKRLMDECTLTIEAVSEKVGKKRPTVNNYLRLLKLPTEIQAGLKAGMLSMGHARALLGIDNPIYQTALYKDIVAKDLSVREVEERVRLIGLPKENKTAPKSDPKMEIQLRDLTRSLSNRYNTKVKINSDAEGKGEIKISFYSQEDLNRLLELLQ